MFENIGMEETILQSLFYDSEYYTKVYSSLKGSHFSDTENNKIFSEIQSFISDNEIRPTIREIALKIKNSDKFDTKVKKSLLEKLSSFQKNEKVNTEFLLKETENFLKKTQLTQAILDSVDIVKSGKELEPVIEKVQESLNVNFNTNPGLDYRDTIEERAEYYHENLRGLSLGIKSADKMLNGGFMDKTLNIFLSPSGGGKSAALVSVGASMLLNGKNVLYITLEMSEKEIAKRFDANILDIDTKSLKNTNKQEIEGKFNSVKEKLGYLFIKEYAAGTFNVLNLKSLIEDIHNSKNIDFDVIIIDYLTLMSSYRTTMAKSGGTYAYFKAIAEECHGFSKSCPANGRIGIPIVSASQLRREAFNNIEVGMDSISDSIGIVQTADTIIGILSTDALRERGECVWKFMKNRNSGVLKDIVLKVNFSKMRFEDFEDSAVEDDVLSELNVTKTTDFGSFKFD